MAQIWNDLPIEAKIRKTRSSLKNKCYKEQLIFETIINNMFQ